MYQVLRLLACINTLSAIKASSKLKINLSFLLLTFTLPHMPSFDSSSMSNVAGKHQKKAVESHSNTIRLPFIQKDILRWIEKSMSISKCTLTSQEKKIFVAGENILSQRRILEDIQRRTTESHSLCCL
mgnify:CR=1 FL=1